MFESVMRGYALMIEQIKLADQFNCQVEDIIEEFTKLTESGLSGDEAMNHIKINGEIIMSPYIRAAIKRTKRKKRLDYIKKVLKSAGIAIVVGPAVTGTGIWVIAHVFSSRPITGLVYVSVWLSLFVLLVLYIGKLWERKE